MKTGPNIAPVAALVGDPARANILTALMSAQALTASELAQEAGVTLQTASSHLSKLQEAGLIIVQKQGRHRYYQLSGSDVAALLEMLMGIAARTGALRVRPGPKEPALRRARVCYDHLAGDMGVQLFESMIRNSHVEVRGHTLCLTRRGEAFCSEFGIDLGLLSKTRRPLCRQCLDWSVRRHHLAGALGAALLKRFYELGWVKPGPETRALYFNAAGDAAFQALCAQ